MTTRKERLINLARVVEAAPTPLFCMQAFVEKTICGTTYCAAGWASLDPWFQQQGFPLVGLKPGHSTGVIHSSEALAEFFSISEADADALFALNAGTHINPYAITKDYVLANIHQLLRGESADEYEAISEE